MQRTIRLCVTVCLLAVSTVFAQAPPGVAVPLDTVTLDSTRLRVHFIDIGPGLAMLVQTPSGQNVFIDGGTWGLDDMILYVKKFVSPPQEIIDIAIVTHADSDHYKGMAKVFNEYKVGQFWHTGYYSSELGSVSVWTDLLRQVSHMDNCKVYMPIEQYVGAGDTEIIDDGGTPTDPGDDVVIRYLNVDSDPPCRDAIFGRTFDEGQRRNNASLVFKLIYKDVTFLITGDINGREKKHEGEATDNEIDSEELELWVRHTLDPETYSLKATVLQAPHHGSNGSCSGPFVKAVDPEWIVITAGHRYNHPHPATLARLQRAGIPVSHILRTDEGDSTPENSHKDPRGDDSYIFETNGTSITKIWRVKMQ